MIFCHFWPGPRPALGTSGWKSWVSIDLYSGSANPGKRQFFPSVWVMIYWYRGWSSIKRASPPSPPSNCLDARIISQRQPGKKPKAQPQQDYRLSDTHVCATTFYKRLSCQEAATLKAMCGDRDCPRCRMNLKSTLVAQPSFCKLSPESQSKRRRLLKESAHLPQRPLGNSSTGRRKKSAPKSWFGPVVRVFWT